MQITIGTGVILGIYFGDAFKLELTRGDFVLRVGHREFYWCPATKECIYERLPEGYTGA